MPAVSRAWKGAAHQSAYILVDRDAMRHLSGLKDFLNNSCTCCGGLAGWNFL
jgi:hypothetical protein